MNLSMSIWDYHDRKNEIRVVTNIDLFHKYL